MLNHVQRQYVLGSLLSAELVQVSNLEQPVGWNIGGKEDRLCPRRTLYHRMGRCLPDISQKHNLRRAVLRISLNALGLFSTWDQEYDHSQVSHSHIALGGDLLV